MHKTPIRAVAALGLLTLTIGLFGGCAPSNGFEARIPVSTPLHENAAVFDLAETAHGAYGASDAEKQVLATAMTLQLENEHLALYTGKYTDIAVQDKETGHIWFSNPAIYKLQDPELTITNTQLAYSPLRLEYFSNSNRANVTDMYVYGDAITDNGLYQATTSVQDGVLRVEYVLGQRQEDMLYFAALTPETYNTIDAKLFELAMAKEIGLDDWGLLEKSYEPPETNGTASEGSEGVYVLYSTATALDMQRLSALMRQLGYTSEQVLAEEQKTGFTKEKKDSPWFSIPVEYRLQGRDFLASVVYSDIDWYGKYKLSRVILLEHFGAAEKNTPGYLFVPNGSGMIVENDKSQGDLSQLTVDFYGSDFGKVLKTSAQLTPSNTLPVFGVKADQTAVCAVVESGDGQSGMEAAISNSESPYNRAYSYFTFYQYDDVATDMSTKLESRKIFSKTMADTTFRVRYHFLYGDSADYSGMATWYRTYLTQTGALTRQTEASSLMTVEFLGSIRKKSTALGIPMTISEPLTTFAQAEEILSALDKVGVSDPDVLLTGILNGGLDHKLNDRATVQKDLGGKNGWLDLVASLHTKGITTYTATSPTLLYRSGNGFSASSMTVRNLDKKYATLAYYDPSTDQRSVDRLAYLVSPLYYTEIMEAFLKSFGKHNSGSQLYLSDTGDLLTGDYNENREIQREQSKHHLTEAVKKAADAGYSLTLDGGNAFLLPYTDRLVNMDLTADGYELQSYSIPFAQMVIHGYIPYSGSAINMESSPQQALLEAVESGAGLYYKLMYQDNTVLLNTKFTSLYSTNYSLWIDEMAQQQKELAQLYSDVALCHITEHARLTKDVACTTYENGVRVLVNYGKTDYTDGDVTVKAGGFAIDA